MEHLNEYLTRSTVNEARGLWCVKLVPNKPYNTYAGMMMAVCSSEKAARVWCMEESATYPGWKLQMKNGVITGLWNQQNGDRMEIAEVELYTKEKTDLGYIK